MGKERRRTSRPDSPGNRTGGRGDNSSPGNRTVRAPSVETGEDVDHDDSHGVMTRLQPVVVMGVLLTGYVATLHPSLPGGDAGELIVAASELGVAHPPGYPLYTMLVKAFCVLVPWGSVAWRANLLTAVLAAAAAACLCHAVRLLSNSVAAGWLAAGLFGFSRLTWAWAVTAEVFGLNDLLLALLMATAVHFSLQAPQASARVSQFGALVCGLCLSNQHTTVIYIAVIVPWVLYSLHARKVLTIALMLRLSAWFVAGLSPYAYLPLSSALSGARWTWGDQTTGAGFLTHLLRREYGTLHLLKDHEGQGFIAGLIAYFDHVGKDLTSMVPILCVTAVFSAYKRWRDRRQEMLIVLLTMVSTYTAFFAWRANLDIHKPLFKGVMERFWLQSDLVVVAMAAVAFSDIFSMIHSLVPVKRYHADKVTAVMLVSMQIGLNLRACDQSSNRVVEDFALTTLRALPPGALVLTKGDLPSNSLRYFHLVEGVRPDIALFDQEVLTYDWSIPKLGGHSPGIAWPGDRLHPHSGVNRQGLRQFTFLQLLDAHYHRKPIFGCIGVQDHEPSWEARYYLRPFGVCVQFIQKGSAVDLSDWLTSSRRFAANWSHPVPVSDSTWEDVASTEMWRAKTAAGLFLLESVDSIQNPKEKASLLRHAYKIYSEAMESGRHFPSYWHKNFALVCEKLRHVAQASETGPLLHTTVTHFRAYLASGTPDPQTAAIQDAIGKLQDYLDFVTRKDQ